MTTILKTEKWIAKVNLDDITIDDFIYRPADAKKITSLLSFAGSMSSLKVLPPEIEDTPFVIEFSEDGWMILSNERKNAVKFCFADVDDLITLVDDLVKVSIDNHTLRPRARGVAQVSMLPGEADVITGRN